MAEAHIGSINHISFCQLIYDVSRRDIQYSIGSSTISIPHPPKFRLALFISSSSSLRQDEMAMIGGDKEVGTDDIQLHPILSSLHSLSSLAAD